MNRKKQNMKILHYLVFFFLIVNWGCIVMEPDIPEGYNSYEKGGKPDAFIYVWELSHYGAVFKMNIVSTGGRKLTRVRACYSETNPLPDTTDRVKDVYFQYNPDLEELLFSISDLEPATNYYCRFYLANSDRGSYTNSVAFSTKVPSDDSSWERVASIPWIEEHYVCGFNFTDRYFAISSLYPVDGGNKLIEYLVETDEWVKRSVLPFGCRVKPVAVVAGGKGYAGLGDIEQVAEDGSRQYFFQQDWWCYDPETNEWERKADIPASTTGLMAAFGIGEKVYVMTAMDFWNSTPMQVWEYDTRSDVWNRKKDFPGDKLQHASSFVINGRPFVFTGVTNRMEEGGDVGDNKVEYTSCMWEYEIDTDTWFRRLDFKGGGREQMVAAGLDGKGYAGFGIQPVTDTYLIRAIDWWCYDPDKDQWSRRSVLTDWFNIQPSFSFVLRGYVYIGSIYDGVWKYVE